MFIFNYICNNNEGEHLLSMLNIIYYVNRCPHFKHHPIDSFLFSSFSQYFNFFEYSTVAGILGKIVNLLCTFAWNFNDIFLMCVCVALSAKFRQLNVYMAANLQKVGGSAWSVGYFTFFYFYFFLFFWRPQHQTFGWNVVVIIASCVDCVSL